MLKLTDVCVIDHAHDLQLAILVTLILQNLFDGNGLARFAHGSLKDDAEGAISNDARGAVTDRFLGGGGGGGGGAMGGCGRLLRLSGGRWPAARTGLAAWRRWRNVMRADKSGGGSKNGGEDISEGGEGKKKAKAGNKKRRALPARRPARTQRERGGGGGEGKETRGVGAKGDVGAAASTSSHSTNAKTADVARFWRVGRAAVAPQNFFTRRAGAAVSHARARARARARGALTRCRLGGNATAFNGECPRCARRSPALHSTPRRHVAVSTARPACARAPCSVANSKCRLERPCVALPPHRLVPLTAFPRFVCSTRLPRQNASSGAAASQGGARHSGAVPLVACFYRLVVAHCVPRPFCARARPEHRFASVAADFIARI
ncbi:shaggy protein kinase [Gracilaria domingensis]|nr:shaggy protein kinase [Gracilaria domingensis]